MLQKLILLLNELESLSSLCNRCGMCQMHCPVFLETKNESDVARGKLTLISGITSEILQHPDNVLKRLNQCLLCGSCSSGCSRNVQTVEVFIKARIIISEYTGLSFFKKLLIKNIVSHPDVFRKTTGLIKKTQHMFFKTEDDIHNSISPRLYMPFLRGRQLQPLSPVAFHDQIEEKGRSNLTGVEKKFNVIFFAGCLIDKIMPEIGFSTLSALEYHNVGVVTYKNEGCCGIPALASGDIESFSKLVEHNIDIFNMENIDYVVTACATCTYTLNKLWPMLYKGNRQEDVSAISNKTIDINQFITSTFLPDTTDIKHSENDTQRVLTIHDPCHLKKSLNISKEPRRLVNENSYYKLVEMKSAESCCGFGGTFNITNYTLSTDIGMKKCKHIEETGADTIATGCPACMLQLKDQLAKKQQHAQVKHFIEIYSETLK